MTLVSHSDGTRLHYLTRPNPMLNTGARRLAPRKPPNDQNSASKLPLSPAIPTHHIRARVFPNSIRTVCIPHRLG